jgi:N4-gp56 family major capsid protein
MLATDELIRKATGTTELAQLQSLVPQIWAAQLEINLRRRAVFEQSAVVNGDLLVPDAGDTVYIPILPDLGPASSLTEGTDMTLTQLTTATSVALKPAEYGLTVEITRKALDRMKYDGMAATMDRASYAMSLAIENAFANLYHTAVPGTSNYFGSVYPNGHTSSTVVVGDVFSDVVMLQAIVQLQQNNAMPFDDGYYRLFISPDQYSSLLQDTNTRQDLRWAAPARLLNGEVGALHGCRIIVTNYVRGAVLGTGDVDTNAAITENSIPVQKALLVSPRWAGIAYKRKPEVIVDPTLYDLGRRRRFGVTADFDVEALHAERAVCITTAQVG